MFFQNTFKNRKIPHQLSSSLNPKFLDSCSMKVPWLTHVSRKCLDAYSIAWLMVYCMFLYNFLVHSGSNHVGCSIYTSIRAHSIRQWYNLVKLGKWSHTRTSFRWGNCIDITVYKRRRGINQLSGWSGSYVRNLGLACSWFKASNLQNKRRAI